MHSIDFYVFRILEIFLDRFVRNILPRNLDAFSQYFAEFKTKNQTSVNIASCVKFCANRFFGSTGAASSSASPYVSSKTEKPLLVLLLVDELAKSRSEHDILHFMGCVLDQTLTLADGRQFVVLPVFTSLSHSLMARLCTRSQRSILPVPLPVPLKSAPAELKEMLQLPSELKSVVDVLCYDVGYHGRMMEIISQILAPNTSLRTRMEAHPRDPFKYLPEIHQILLEHESSKGFFAHLLSNPLHLIQPVCYSILGRAIGREAPFADRLSSTSINQLDDTKDQYEIDSFKPQTYDELLSVGVFIGDAGTASALITPVMSPLQLVKWAIARKQRRPCDDRTSLFVDTVIQVFSAQSSHNWKSFEKFHHSTLSP
jgi:hypothetical protein